MKESTHLWDAIAVNLKTRKVRIFGTNETKDNAEAISTITVMRRGLDEEFYTEVEAGTYKEDDTYP